VAESIVEQIAAALKTSFSGIVGDAGASYWYTPDKVVRVSFFPDDFSFDEAHGSTIYVLSQAAEDVSEERSSHGCTSSAGFVLQVGRLHKVASENPYLEVAPIRATVINRIVRDAIKRLFADVTLGGLAANVVETSLSIDRDQYHPHWAMAQLAFQVEYRFDGGAP
jgi:hypothetical protein